MSVPINTRGLLSSLTTSSTPHPATQSSSPTPTPLPSTIPFSASLTPGCITRTASTLPTWDTSRPILRFDFATPTEQATFHRAFAQVKSEKDRAEFMARYFDNYDGVVGIPLRPIMDTSRDEDMARELQSKLPVMLDTAQDESLAQEMLGTWEPLVDVERDEELARVMQERLSLDAESEVRSAAGNDEAMARRVQREMERENGRRADGGFAGERTLHTGRPTNARRGVEYADGYQPARIPFRPMDDYGGASRERYWDQGYRSRYGYGQSSQHHEDYYSDEEGNEHFSRGERRYGNGYGYEPRNGGRYGPRYGGHDYRGGRY